MKSFECVITDPVGMHARPAGKLVKEAKELDSKITVIKDDKEVDATKLMMLMSLGIKKGDKIKVTIEGGDEDAAYDKMVNFFKENL